MVCGALATATLATDLVTPRDVVAITLAGVLGSVLPDIDLKDSRPSRAMFAGLAIFFSFAVLFSVESRYSIAEMLILWLGTLVLVRFVAGNLFHRFSYHRGIWHSLLAAAFSSFLTAAVFYWMLGRDESVSWFAALFMMVGFLTHLILDEIYSVDVMDTRIKASFGTALKLIDGKHLGHTSAMAAAAVIAFMLAPSIKPFVAEVCPAAGLDGAAAAPAAARALVRCRLARHRVAARPPEGRRAAGQHQLDLDRLHPQPAQRTASPSNKLTRGAAARHRPARTGPRRSVPASAARAARAC